MVLQGSLNCISTTALKIRTAIASLMMASPSMRVVNCSLHDRDLKRVKEKEESDAIMGVLKARMDQ